MNFNKLTCALTVILFLTLNVNSQVGVGTTNPTSALEIMSTNTGIPALEINPQSAPVGSADGQLAVIGDKLYLFDTSRANVGTPGKWLSVEVSVLPFGRNGNADNTNLKTAGNSAQNRSGYLMPFNGTIIHATVRSNNNSGAQAKQFDIQVRTGNTNISSTSITTAAAEATNTNLNVDFSAGNFINVRINNDGNGNVNNPVLTLWVKWRE